MGARVTCWQQQEHHTFESRHSLSQPYLPPLPPLPAVPAVPVPVPVPPTAPTLQVEFGAHQVILVRSMAAVDQLPEEIRDSNAIIMTVPQAKGLEFDDVRRMEGCWRACVGRTQ